MSVPRLLALVAIMLSDQIAIRAQDIHAAHLDILESLKPER